MTLLFIVLLWAAWGHNNFEVGNPRTPLTRNTKEFQTDKTFSLSPCPVEDSNTYAQGSRLSRAGRFTTGKGVSEVGVKRVSEMGDPRLYPLAHLG